MKKNLKNSKLLFVFQIMKTKLMILFISILILTFTVSFTLKLRNENPLKTSSQLSNEQLAKTDGKWLYFKKGNKISINELIEKNYTLFDLPQGINSRIEKEDTDELGMKHFLLKLEMYGIPIEDGVYTAHYSKEGDLMHVVGKYDKNAIPKEKTLPAISRTEAFQKAKDAYITSEKFTAMDHQKMISDELTNLFNEVKISPQLVYFRSEKNESLKLCFKVSIVSELITRFLTYYIDAETGEVLKIADHRMDALATVETVYNGTQYVQIEWRGFPYNYYYLRHDGFSTPIETRNSSIRYGYPYCTPWGFGNLDRVHKDNTYWHQGYEANAASSHWAVKEAYTVFKNNYGRTYGTFSSSGGEIRMENNYTSNGPFYMYGGSYDYIHVGQTGGTAGFEGSLDVIAHEFSHGVMYRARSIDESAYNDDETGALCESFADIFGIMVEYYTTGTTDYIVGSNLLDYYKRSLQNPRAYPSCRINAPCDANCVSQIYSVDPRTVPLYYLENPYWIFDVNQGSSHVNNSVQNYWFYMLANGGNQLGVSVSGIGLNYASQITYRNMVYYLTTTSDFDDMRQASIANASALHGECSNPYYQVQNAWAAVGVGAAATPCLDVQISGYDYLMCNEQGYFYANVTGGSGTYSYQWYVDYVPYSNDSYIYAGWYPQYSSENHYISLEVTSGSLSDTDDFNVFVESCNWDQNLEAQSNSTIESIKISAHPNPASSHSQIVIEDEITQEPKEYIIQISDGNGRVVHSDKTYATDFTINTSSFQKGIYNVVIRTNRKSGSVKLIVK